MSSPKQQPIRQVKIYPHMVWYIALKIMKYLVMIVQIKWIANTREQELRRREVGIQGKKNQQETRLCSFCCSPNNLEETQGYSAVIAPTSWSNILCFSLQLLFCCSWSLPAVAAAIAAVAATDVLTTDVGRSKSAQLPIHEVQQEVAQPTVKDMHGHHHSVLWEWLSILAHWKWQ